jgi:hypothetical protein
MSPAPTESAPWCVLVDAYGAGARLAPEFRSRGLRCLHLFSAPEMERAIRTFRPADYDACLVHDGDPGATAAALRERCVVAVVAGSPGGAELADRLAEILSIPGHAPGRRDVRRSAAVPAGGALPHGVTYILNAVSGRGRHFFTDIWREVPGTPAGAPGQRVLLDGAGPTLQRLQALAAAALDERGIQTGPSRTEVVHAGAGPVLVSCVAGLDPLADPDLHAACIGLDTAGLIADACLDPDRFEIRTRQSCSLRQHARIVFLRPPRPGRVRALPGLRALTALPTCLYVLTRFRPGDPVGPDAAGGGHAVLAGPDPEELEIHAAFIRGIESEPGLYAVEPAAREEPAVPVEVLQPAAALRDRFLERGHYLQAEAYADLMTRCGWRARRVASALVLILPRTAGHFAKMQRPRRIDPAALAALCRAEEIVELVVEPANRAMLLDGGREEPLAFNPADPAPWLTRMAALGFTPAARRYASSKSLVLPLPASDAELLASFAPKRRREVRRARDEEVDYAVCPFPDLDEATLAEMARLHAAWDDSRHFPGFDEPFLASVRQAFGGAGHCVLARRRGRLAAVFYLLLHDRVGFYYYTFAEPAPDRSHLGVGGVHLAMRFARDAGCDFFDLGAGFDERYPESCATWQGFSFFKEQFRPFPVYHPPSLVFNPPPQ